MSINITGTAEPINIDALPGTAVLGFQTGTHQVTAFTFDNTEVTASLPSLGLSPINAQAGSNTVVQPPAGTLSLAAINAVVVGTPSTTNIDITASAPSLPLSASNPTVTYVAILPIPTIVVAEGGTHDMGQYVVGNITDSQVLGINPAIATYSHSTRLITGVTEGNLTGLQFEVTH